MDRTSLSWADLHSLRKGVCVYLCIYFWEETYELCILGVTTFVENYDISSDRFEGFTVQVRIKFVLCI